MRKVAALAALLLITLPGPADALPRGLEWSSIDGGMLQMDDWRGAPVLVVNTASLCGFTRQFDDLQALHERYADRGLVVLAVPSDDFNQELGSATEVQEFCEVNFGLTLPMTDITPVRGARAHPFYRWLADQHGFTPGWNFHKVLVGPDGKVAGTWGSGTRPTSAPIRDRIEAMLP
jgi:glutathione peroxidase